MKEIRSKNESETLLVQNTSGSSKIVLIMPITRNNEKSNSRWASVISLMNNSEIEFLIIIDKTIDGSATNYFMHNFVMPNRILYVLPRSINESHYESLGSIQLEDNLWVMQLHDDDRWEGRVALPNLIDRNGAYYSQFYVKSQSRRYLEEENFLRPARINFVLVPSRIWNQFALFVQNQKFHVAGSLDSTLNQMVQLTCNFSPLPDFAYYYDNHNWSGRAASKRSLKRLTVGDGWGSWATTDIALLGRLLDNLSSLIYVDGFAKPDNTREIYIKLMSQFKPRLRRRALIRFEILALQALSVMSQYLPDSFRGIYLVDNLESRLSRSKFIRDSWSIKQLADIIELIPILQREKQFGKLQNRFHFWNTNILRLQDMFGA